MWGFSRKSSRDRGTAQTFVEATGGGWDEPPTSVPIDGGSQAGYVRDQLARAAEEAKAVGVGETFTYTLTDIPSGIISPHDIVFGMIMQADGYGLSVDMMMNDTIKFTRHR